VLEALHDWIVHVVADHGILAIAVLMTLESACIPIPSEVTMLVGGALAATAFAGAGRELDLWAVVLAGTLGNLLGSWLAYWAGAARGRDLVDRFGRYLLIRPHELDRAQVWFARRGEVAVFASRLLPVVRTFISLPAGVARMRFGRFSAYTLAGCLPWCLALAWAGRAFGERWRTVEHTLEPVSWAVAGALAIATALYVARRWRRVRTEYALLDAARREGLGP
jgi:membrane protein DedA with SNARE-associated domain